MSTGTRAPNLSTISDFAYLIGVTASGTTGRLSSTALATILAASGPLAESITGALSTLARKAPVAAVATSNITLSGEQTIDGVLTSASRVLVAGQTDATQNGIYISGAGAWARVTDADTDAEILNASVFVTGGTTYGSTTWLCTGAPELGVDEVVWIEVAGLNSSETAASAAAAAASASAASDSETAAAASASAASDSETAAAASASAASDSETAAAASASAASDSETAAAASASAASDSETAAAASASAASDSAVTAADNAALAVTLSDQLLFDQTIGLTAAPATGTAFGANTYVYATAVTRNSTIRQMRVWAAATGTFKVRRFGKFGDVFTQVGSDLNVTVSSTGSLTLEAGTDFAAFEVLAGEYLGFYNDGSIARVATTGTAFYTATGDLTTFTDATTQNNIAIQLGFDLRALETDLIRDEVDALDARVTAAEVITNGTSGARIIGRDGAFVSASASGANGPAAFGQPVHFTGAVDQITLFAAATGTFYAKKFTKAGNVFTQVGADTELTVSAAGLNTFTAGTDFTAIPVEPGQYLGFFVNSVPAMASTAGEAVFLHSGTGNATTLTDTQSQSNVQFQVAFRVTPSIVPSASVGGMIAGKGDVAVDAPASGVIVGHLGYGQSWMDRNGDGGALAAFEAVRFPMTAITLEDTEGPAGWGGGSRIASSKFWPAHEVVAAVQSVMGPMVNRLALNSRRIGRRAVFFGRQEGQGGRTIQALLPPDDPDYAVGGNGYINLIACVTDAVSIAATLGLKFEVGTVTWVQGLANGGTTVAAYTTLFNTLIDHIQTDIMAETGQDYPPQILVVQPPGTETTGAVPPYQAQVEVAAARPDVTLACAAWAIEQHDETHFSPEGCVQLGEILALAAEAVAIGQPWGAPYLRNVTRSGTTITAYVGGPHGVVVDTSVATVNHQVSGSPVANYGFEYSGASITAVTVEPRKITITLDADASGTLAFAYHDGDRGDTYNANRGTIRADWKAKSAFLDRDLALWMASGFWAL